MSLVCANSISEEYAVIGVDVPSEKSLRRIKALNEGRFPLVADDPKIDEFFENSIIKGNFYATADPIAFEMADVVILIFAASIDVTNVNDVNLVTVRVGSVVVVVMCAMIAFYATNFHHDDGDYNYCWCC